MPSAAAPIRKKMTLKKIKRNLVKLQHPLSLDCIFLLSCLPRIFDSPEFLFCLGFFSLNTTERQRNCVIFWVLETGSRLTINGFFFFKWNELFTFVVQIYFACWRKWRAHFLFLPLSLSLRNQTKSETFNKFGGKNWLNFAKKRWMRWRQKSPI